MTYRQDYEAAKWVLRVEEAGGEGNLPERERRALVRWLRQSPQNVEALLRSLALDWLVTRTRKRKL